MSQQKAKSLHPLTFRVRFFVAGWDIFVTGMQKVAKMNYIQAYMVLIAIKNRKSMILAT